MYLYFPGDKFSCAAFDIDILTRCEPTAEVGFWDVSKLFQTSRVPIPLNQKYFTFLND